MTAPSPLPPPAGSPHGLLISSPRYAGLSMAEQFRLLSETTVAVSPCGGVSMILPFLPPGAYAVLLNYMLGPGEAQAPPRPHPSPPALTSA